MHAILHHDQLAAPNQQAKLQAGAGESLLTQLRRLCRSPAGGYGDAMQERAGGVKHWGERGGGAHIRAAACVCQWSHEPHPLVVKAEALAAIRYPGDLAQSAALHVAQQQRRRRAGDEEALLMHRNVRQRVTVH